MKLEEFVKGFAEQFEDTDPAEITVSTNFQDLDEWDSLAALNIIAFVRTSCGKNISGREIRGCQSVEELYNLVESK